MPELDELLDQLHGGVGKSESATADLVREQQRALSLEREIKELARRYDDRNPTHRRRRAELQKNLGASRERLDGLRKSRDALAVNLVELRGQLEPLIDPDRAIGALDSRIPILMFPVRLETRFVGPPSRRELLVRIYPDDCTI